MKIRVYIIESANTEISTNVFKGNEVSHSVETYEDNPIDFSMIDRLVVELNTRYSTDIEVCFIDKQYMCDYYYTNEGKEEKKLLDRLKERYDFFSSDWYEYIQEFPNFEPDVHHFFISRKHFINCYHMANHLQLPIQSNFYYKWGIESIFEALDARSYYNIFSAIPKIDQIDSFKNPMYKGEEDNESIKWIVEYGVSQCKQLIAAGCLKRERFMQYNVEDWVTNVYSPYSNGIIIEYDMILAHPETEFPVVFRGQSPQKCFNELADYRYYLVDYMLRTLAKYGLEFGKITSVNGNYQTINLDFLL